MTIKLKLLIDKDKNRVALAESDKYFVDTLFSFLTIPIGSIVRLSSQKSNIGCMDALQESVKNLDSQYLQTEALKEMLLCLRSAWEARTNDLALNVNTELTRNVMRTEVVVDKNGINDGVFVKRTTRFMIGDDLQVGPISTMSCMSLLDKLGVREWAALEEKCVDVGAKEALHILRQLLVSNTPLTDVFLPKPEAVEDAFHAPKLNAEDITIDKNDTGKKMSLKRLISKYKNRVLYAEATEDFLDLLFSFLSFPLGAIVNLLRPGSSIGCLDNLYKSVEDLSGDDNCIISDECRAMLLDPKLALHSGCENQLLPVVEAAPKTFDISLCYPCVYCGMYPHHASCPCLKSLLLHFINPKLSYAATKTGGGFVKRTKIMFMVTDGLDVEPLSLFSGISILDRYQVPISDVQERVVSVGQDQIEPWLTDPDC